MATERVERVAQAIQEEAAQILQRELKDPRIGFVTVTRVRVSPDLQHATIYYSVMEGQSAEAPGEASSSRNQGKPPAPAGSSPGGPEEETAAGLRSAQGFVRKLLGERLRLRVTPEIRFEADSSVAENIRISKLLGGLKKDSEQ